jgi:thiamine biosynthesis protein ThiI
MSDAAAAPPRGAAPEESTLLLRFGELTLKSEAVRRRFTQILRRNIEESFSRAGLDCLIRDDWGHLYVDTSDLNAGLAALSRTFGLTSVSPVAVLRTAALPDVAAHAADYALRYLPESARTFAVRPRRTGSHPYSSTDVGRVCGSAIQQAAAAAGRPLSVNLDTPDFEVEVEVRENTAYLYVRRFPCVGGMPLGSAGKVICVVREGDPESDWDARAAWMIMKRGCLPIYAAQGDEATRTPSPRAAHALERLRPWAPNAKHWVAADPTKPDLLAAMARRFEAHAVVVGARASSGEVQGPVELLEGYPTFHPLLALSEEELAKIPLDA